MSSQPIEHVPAQTDPDAIEQILLRDGVVIIDRLIEESFVERILDEVAPWFDRAPDGSGEWLGTKTRRLHGLLKKSEGIRQKRLQCDDSGSHGPYPRALVRQVSAHLLLARRDRSR